MSNRTYVCFHCRTTERVPAVRITRTCRKCREQAEHVYHKFKVPKRDDDDAWSELEGKVKAFNREAKSRVLPFLRQERAGLERLLAKVPQSKQSRLRALRFKLKVVNEKINKWGLWPG